MPVPIPAYDVDEALVRATARDRVPRVHLYRPDQTSVVLGRGGKRAVEVDVAAVEADDVPLLRRRGGGCAVVLDPGNLILSVILPTDGIGGSKAAFRDISAWLIRALAAMGIEDVRQTGISDLSRDGRKLGGSCIYQSNKVLYYTTTLLFDPDLDRVARYLRHPPREPDYRRGRDHRAFMGRLSDSLPGIDIDGFAIELGHRLRRAGIPETSAGVDANEARWLLPTAAGEQRAAGE